MAVKIAGELHSEKLDRSWGRALDESSVIDGLNRFLSGCDTPERKEQVKQLIVDKLCGIREWFLTQCEYRFFASSILILLVDTFDPTPV